ncbi:MAG: T9SS type A sorting domain-containing protein [Flavobacterium sp.]
MKKIVSLIILLAANCFSQAPTIQWQKTFGGIHEENAYSVLQTADGGYIFAGRANSGNGDVVGYSWAYSLFNGDAWIVKTDAAGTIEWQKLYGGFSNDSALRIIPTSDGGYAVACISSSTDGTVTNNIGGYDYWILKLSATGDLQWQKNLGGPGDDFVRDIKQTPDGGYIVIGYSSSNLPNGHGMKEVYLVKISSTGVIQWWKPFGGSNDDLGNSVALTPDGGYIITGTTKSSDGNFTSNHGMSDIFAIKINSIGTIEWQKTMGGSNEDFGQSIIALPDGSYVLSAASSSSNGDITTTNRGSTDLWIAKLDTTGNIVWQKSFGGSSSDCYDGSRISQTSDGGFVICGSTTSGSGDASGNHGSGIEDIWVVKLDSDGTKQWHRCFGGGGEDYGYSIIETSDKGYMVSGMGRVDVGTNPQYADWTYNAQRSYEAWLIKLEPDSFLLSVPENTMASITVFPNPAKDILNIHASNNATISKITITDLLGKKVLEQSENNQIDVQNLAKGVYAIQVAAEGSTYASKFIKE